MAAQDVPRASGIGDILILGLSLVLVIITGIFLVSPQSTYTVVLSEDGFSPQELFVNEGDVARFVTDRNEEFLPIPIDEEKGFWDFRPPSPIKPGEVWEYKFKREGVLAYTNNLAPYYSPELGFVAVGPKARNKIGCNYWKDAESECWLYIIQSTFRRGGLGSAFQRVKELYETYPAFVSECHRLTHFLGGIASRVYKDNPDKVLLPETPYCNGGFYHGFTDVWFHLGGDLNDIEEFCKSVEDRFSAQAAPSACYHGFGHVLGHSTEVKNWENIFADLRTILLRCDNALFSENCLNGLFREMAGRYYEEQIKPLGGKDPFGPCKTLALPYKEKCYELFSVILLAPNRQDFEGVLASIEFLPSGLAESALIRVVEMMAFRDFADRSYENGISSCRNLAKFTKLCLENYIQVVVDNGVPDKEVEGAAEFCGSEFLTPGEQIACKDFVRSYGEKMYGVSL